MRTLSLLFIFIVVSVLAMPVLGQTPPTREEIAVAMITMPDDITTAMNKFDKESIVKLRLSAQVMFGVIRKIGNKPSPTLDEATFAAAALSVMKKYAEEATGSIPKVARIAAVYADQLTGNQKFVVVAWCMASMKEVDEAITIPADVQRILNRKDMRNLKPPPPPSRH